MSFPQLPHLVIMAIRSKLAVHVTWIKMILLKTRWEQSRRRPSAQEVLIPIYLESTLFTPLRLRSMITVNQRNTGSVAGYCGPTLVNGLSMHNGTHHFRDICLIASQGHILKYFCCCHDVVPSYFLDEGLCYGLLRSHHMHLHLLSRCTCCCTKWSWLLPAYSLHVLNTDHNIIFFCPLSFFRPLKSKVCNLKNCGFLIELLCHPHAMHAWLAAPLF